MTVRPIPPAPPPPYVLAEPWRRLAAWGLDAVPFLAVGALAFWGLRGAAAVRSLARSLVTKQVDPAALGLPGDPLHGALATPAAALHLLAVAAVGLLVAGAWVGYRIGATAATGRTLGKWLLGIAVVDSRTPSERPSLSQAVRRWAVPQGTGLVPLPFTGMAPYAWVLRDRRRQGLHDKAAGTLVVRRPR